MRATIPIAIPPGTKALRIERVLNTLSLQGKRIVFDDAYWILWINANYNFTLGTQLVLYPDGRIDNVTQHEDGTETVFTVKGQD